MKTFQCALSTFALLSLSCVAAQAQAQTRTEVDLQLVLAVDISYSMDESELATQREGYISAITSPEVMKAIQSGLLGRVAVTYMEWAGTEQQHVVADWHLIENLEDAQKFADALAKAPLRRAYRTSISGALHYAANLFDRGSYQGLRQVIDLSGDGPNNNGPPVTLARDAVLARGIAINGLPLMLDTYPESSEQHIDLEGYYRDCVIGGTGSFLVPVNGVETFHQAVRTKMVLEIAGYQPPVTFQRAVGGMRVPCVSGEVMWQQP